MAEVKSFQADGSTAGTKSLPDSVFGARILVEAVQLSVLRQLANARRANPRTLTKGDVRGGGRKPFRQKGTGRARQGSTRNPQWRGGGVAHGPDGRDYTLKMNKRTRKQALASILTDLVKQERLSVLAAPAFDAPKTKDAVKLLESMGMKDRKVLFVTPEQGGTFQKSVRNIPRIKAIQAKFLNPHDLMSHEFVVLFDDVVEPIVAHLTSPRRPAVKQEASA